LRRRPTILRKTCSVSAGCLWSSWPASRDSIICPVPRRGRFASWQMPRPPSRLWNWRPLAGPRGCTVGSHFQATALPS